MRAVIDTNLLVAAMISRPGSAPRKLLEAVRDGRLKLVVSQPLIDEFLDVMSRPKLARYGITIGIVLDFLESLLAVASLVAITGAPKGCDDPDDDAVIETAEVGAADYLITGDSDLLEERIRAPDRGHIDTDVQFGVTRGLIGDFVRHDEPHPDSADVAAPWFSLAYIYVMEPGEAVLPLPPIK